MTHPQQDTQVGPRGHTATAPWWCVLTLHWMYMVWSCPSPSCVMICIMCGCWKAFSSTLSTAQIRWMGMEERTCKMKPPPSPLP